MSLFLDICQYSWVIRVNDGFFSDDGVCCCCSQVTKLPSYHVPMFSSSQVTKSPGSQVTKFPSSEVPIFPNSQVPKFPSSQFPSPKVPKSPSSQVPKVSSSQVPKFQSSKVLKFPISKVPLSLYPFVPLSLCPFVPLSHCPFVPLSLNEWVGTKIWSKEINVRQYECIKIEKPGVGRPLLGPAKMWHYIKQCTMEKYPFHRRARSGEPLTKCVDNKMDNSQSVVTWQRAEVVRN